MKKQLYRAAAATVLGLSLTTGIVAADNSGTIDGTGVGSSNRIEATTKNRVEVKNDTKLKVDNDNDQHAYSGDAKVSHNNSGGSATSGDASNDNSTTVDATVDNSGASGALGGGSWNADASISDTGVNSKNTVKSSVDNKVEVTNKTDINVKNDNDQRASTGDATVSYNNEGGDATSGSASNTNSSSFTFSVMN